MTPELIEAMIYSGLAGAAIPLGGLLAYGEHIRPQWLQQELRHSVIAFGGGALLAAVSFILVPKGIENLPAAGAVSALFAGALFFFWLDRAIAKHGGSHAQLIAMIADFVPEAMALGAIFAHGDTAAPLLAALIGLQNLPEGFNAYREMCSKDGQPPARILKLFGGLMLLGPLAAILGAPLPRRQSNNAGHRHAVCRWWHPVSCVPGYCATSPPGKALGAAPRRSRRFRVRAARPYAGWIN